jgi:ribosome-associated protein
MRPVCSYTDFFVLCTGQNPRQTRAIYDEVYHSLKAETGAFPRSREGQGDGTWVIGDYVDVVLHIFTPDTRAFYRLEDLWGDVPQLEVAEAAG